MIPQLDPIQQANAAIAEHNIVRANGDKIVIIPSIDIEQGGLPKDQAIRHAQYVVGHIEDRLGIEPMVYTSQSKWKEIMGKCGLFGHLKLWVANYTSRPKPRMPYGWEDWGLWQRFIIKVLGLPGSVDENEINPLYGLPLVGQTPVEPPTWPRKAVVLAYALKLRTAPTIHSNILGYVQRGMELDVYEEVLVERKGSNQKDIWIRTNNQDPNTWCAMTYADNIYVRYL